ncbi:hypothetical protein H6G41_07970 [Tolypothrix sp. FACHB-123]|uniref:hypothetical protein n=1 Tax=Tolypothrix sp. FACHB-123 TaxID=2692868 RepID=UPI0016861425|nr:hypothetical protein [Tolypothrix sp. FACHB-123]MBD2354565.1 hypothetical protein [Tolypothrix sp. FACHB-123]
MRRLIMPQSVTLVLVRIAEFVPTVNRQHYFPVNPLQAIAQSKDSVNFQKTA